MKKVKREVVNASMDQSSKMLREDFVSYNTLTSYKIEKEVWDGVQEGLGLGDHRWNYSVDHHWIGNVK